MIKEKLDRINALAALQRERELTEEELAERRVLRMEYIAEWRAGAVQVLENTWIVDEKGNKRPLPRRDRKEGSTQ